jgi:hypothetical protein
MSHFESSWDTALNGLIWNDLQIQIATRLPSKNVYGFGENNHRSFKHSFDFKTWPIFTRDQIPAFVNIDKFSVKVVFCF